jgi:hypothetical protein
MSHETDGSVGTDTTEHLLVSAVADGLASRGR